MNFTQISYFLAILRTGSFSAAADESFISQSALSKQIQALETELGAKIFRREHSKVFLTEAGYEFFSFAEKADALRVSLDRKLRRYTQKDQETLSIGSIPVVTAASYGVSDMFAKFQVQMLKQGKYINFDLFADEQNTVFHALKNNKIDLAFLRPPYASTDLCDTLLVAKDEFVFICHKDNPLSQKKIIAIEEMKNEAIILITPRSSIYQAALGELAKHGVSDSVVSTTGRHTVLLQMVANDLGVTLLPRRLLEDEIFPDLAAVPLAEPFGIQLVLAKQKERKLPLPAQEFWDFIEKYYKLDE